MSKLTTVVFCLVVSLYAHAQNQVSGKVVDELGFPVASASITLEGTEEVVYSDLKGMFSLDSEKDFYWKIEIASQGYETESFYILEGGNAGIVTLNFAIDLDDLLNDEPKSDSKAPKTDTAKNKEAINLEKP